MVARSLSQRYKKVSWDIRWWFEVCHRDTRKCHGTYDGGSKFVTEIQESVMGHTMVVRSLSRRYKKVSWDIRTEFAPASLVG